MDLGRSGRPLMLNRVTHKILAELGIRKERQNK
jgi:hypothetical protein